VSDESTAMIDPEGRELLMGLLRRLALDDGIGVVHVTHRAGEARAADATFNLGFARRATVRVDRRVTTRAPGSPVIVLRRVGYVYSRATPWAHRALEGVDLLIGDGESVLVVGHNGSGKSTLAWIIAGLIAPTEGEALLDGEPLHTQVGRVGLAFQHARLQLLRPTVENEVRSASDATTDDVHRALMAVGLDPGTFAERRIDELSGGQLRRVVLAGVLAASPRALVLDEPFAGLDDDGRAELTSVLSAVRASRQIALVIVSHDRDLPDGVVDRVVELEDGCITRDHFVAGAASRVRDVPDETPA
jgi:energy-coupling factor transport system ATP-binding protein